MGNLTNGKSKVQFLHLAPDPATQINADPDLDPQTLFGKFLWLRAGLCAGEPHVEPVHAVRAGVQLRAPEEDRHAR